MYLTRFQINPQRRQARRMLSSPHIMHASVMSGFPGATSTEDGRVLWRLDEHDSATLLYLVSPEQPDLSHMVEQAGWPTVQGWETRDYAELLDRLEVGHRYVFRLTANPVHSVRFETGRRGSPLGHVTPAQQLNWLTDREERAGFTTLIGSAERDLSVTGRRTLAFQRGTSTVTLRVADFAGTLKITDRDRFVQTLCSGIGRARGYGCGLLTVAPLKPAPQLEA